MLSLTPTPNNDIVIKVHYPELAANVLPGQYVHFSRQEITQNMIGYVLGTEAATNSVSLYVNADILSAPLSIDDLLWVSQAKGSALPLPEFSHRALLVADKWGLPSILFLSQLIAISKLQNKVVVLLSAEQEFPFKPQPSRYLLPGMPAGVIAACPLLEDRKIPSRLICDAYLPGCYEGSAIEFLSEYSTDNTGCDDLTIHCAGNGQFVTSVNQWASARDILHYSISLP